VAKLKTPCWQQQQQQQHQTTSVTAAPITLQQPVTPITTASISKDATSRLFTDIDSNNGDPNIREGFQEIVTYGDSEYWF